MSAVNFKVGDRVRSLGENPFGEDCESYGLVGTIVRIDEDSFGGPYLIDFGPEFDGGHDGNFWGQPAYEEGAFNYYFLDDNGVEAA